MRIRSLVWFVLCIVFVCGVATAAEPLWITPPNAPSVARPKMRWAPGSFAKDPSVVRFDGRYMMYFSFPPKAPGGLDAGWSIGIAASANLVDWELVGHLLPMQDCDQKGLCAPCAKVIDGAVHLFYQTYGSGPKDAICHAVAPDGIHFTPDPANPVFRPHGDWTNGRAIDADVVRFKGRVFLYAATRDPKGKIQKLVVASAEPDMKQWRQAADKSILYPQLAWETNCIEAPSVLEKDGRLYMFYAGGYNNDPQQIGVAVSEDGVTWKRLWNVPFLPNGPKNQWNASESGHPGIFEDENGKTWLFFQGNRTHGKDWYLSRVPIVWKKNADGMTVPAVVETE